jgi:hypothetical protein
VPGPNYLWHHDGQHGKSHFPSGGMVKLMEIGLQALLDGKLWSMHLLMVTHE